MGAEAWRQLRASGAEGQEEEDRGAGAVWYRPPGPAGYEPISGCESAARAPTPATQAADEDAAFTPLVRRAHPTRGTPVKAPATRGEGSGAAAATPPRQKRRAASEDDARGGEMSSSDDSSSEERRGESPSDRAAITGEAMAAEPPTAGQQAEDFLNSLATMPEPLLPPGMPPGWPPQAEDTRSGAEDDEDGNVSDGECDGGAGGGAKGAKSGEGNDRGDDEGGGEKGGGEDNGRDSGGDGGESDEAVQAAVDVWAAGCGGTSGAAVGGLGEDTAMVEAIAGLQPVGAGRGARRVTFSGIDVVLGAAETDTGARGEQSEALDEAGEGLRAAEGDKASGQKRRAKQSGASGGLAKLRAAAHSRQAGASDAG